DQLETLTVETPIPTVSSPVPTACFTDFQKPSSDTRLISKRVANQVETPSLDNILTLINRFEDILRVTINSVDSDEVEADVSNMETTITTSHTLTLRIHKDHPKSQIIGPVDTLIQTTNKSKEVKSMQEELLKFKIQNVWTLVDCPKGVRPIGIKWVLKNKKDERGIVIRNKARLVAQGHTQEEGIGYDEVFAPVARIEAIRLFLAYASFMRFTVYQMDVKSTFLYGTIDEEVGTIDQTLFIRRQRGDFILLQVYVDDIIFGSSNPQLCREFKALMHEKFQMSAMGTSKYWGVLRILMISLSLIPLSEHNIDFHPIVDFVEASPLRYALTFKPTVYVSHIRQFWSTARIETTKEGTKILATIDGILRTVTESSLRRNLKLKDEEGISSLPDAELFKNLTLMRYNISPNQSLLFKRASFPISGSISSIPSYEPASPLRDVSQGKACPTDSRFEANQDRANIAKTSTLLYESTSRVPSLAADEGSLQLQIQELTDLCTSLQRQQSDLVSKFEAQELEINRLKARVKLFEDREGGVTEQFGDDAPIKERNLDEGEAAAERVSNDTAEMVTVGCNNDVVPTSSLIFAPAIIVTPYIRQKGKEKMVETDTPKKKRFQEQMDIQMARQLEEEMERDA
nr:hypothetical protein [Tanacetum cinerariifolium]